MRVAYVSRELADRARAAAEAGHEVHLISEDPGGTRPLAPARADHRYLSGAQAHADRVYDTLRSLHAAAPLDVVEFVDAEGWTVVRAQRLLGEFAGVRLVAHAGPRPAGDATLDAAIARHLADYSRRHAAGNPVAGPATGAPVTVVIPVWNQGRYLRAAIDSARLCGYRPLEIVVVDDGSTEPGTVAALDALAGVTVIRQSHQGLPAARNAGIAAARGAFVIPLDADDLLPAGFVAPAVAALERDARIGCVAGEVRNFGLLEHVGVPLGYVPDVSLVVNTFPRATAVFRAGVLAEVGGYDPQLPAYEDWDLYLRLHKAGYAVECAPLTGQLYRRHPDSMTFRQTDAARIALTQRLLRTHADLLGDSGALPLLLTLVDLWKSRYEPSASVAWQRQGLALAGVE
jgi:hypothetical protein